MSAQEVKGSGHVKLCLLIITALSLPHHKQFQDMVTEKFFCASGAGNAWPVGCDRKYEETEMKK